MFILQAEVIKTQRLQKGQYRDPAWAIINPVKINLAVEEIPETVFNTFNAAYHVKDKKYGFIDLEQLEIQNTLKDGKHLSVFIKSDTHESDKFYRVFHTDDSTKG